LHGLQFFVDIELFARLEKQNLHPMRGKHMRHHASRRAGTDHHGIVDAFQVDVGGAGFVRREEEIHGRMPRTMLQNASYEPLRFSSSIMASATVSIFFTMSGFLDTSR